MNFQRLTAKSDILSLIRYHSDHTHLTGVDVETTSVDPRQAKLLDIQITGYDADSVVIFDASQAELLLEFAPEVVLVAHNYKYDAHVLFRHGVDLLDRTWRDTMLVGHLLDENRESYKLDSFVKEYWQDDYKEKFWGQYKTYEEAPDEVRLEYAGKDVVYTLRLIKQFMAELVTSGVPVSLVEHVHHLASELLRTEIEGIEVDLDYLSDISIKLKAEIERLKPAMRQLVEPHCALWEMQAYEKELAKRKTEKGKQGVVQPVFSFDSAKQLSWLLYNSLGLPEQKNDKTKAISVDDASLEKLHENHPVIPLVQEYRGHQKVHTAFIVGTREKVSHGRIYPEFRVNGTKTGRISHANPNLGQLPKAGGIRGIYRPEESYCFISADYSQLEVCIEANLTGDPNLERIFRDGLSKHDITAQELGIDRDTAKTLNFALQYMASHFKVAKLLKVSENEGKRVWDAYWKIYSGPKQLKASTDRAVDQGQPLITGFGRRRRFEVRNRSPWDGDYRQAYNFLIQGTGADITSRAFYLVSSKLRSSGMGRGLFTVHDELLIKVKRECAEEAEALMLNTMVSVGEAIGLKIPLKAESSGLMSRWND